MKKLLFPALLLAPMAQAHDVACPKFYPWEDTRLAEVPYRHQGVGIVAKSELTGASAMGSPPSVKPPMEFRGAPERKIKGGIEIEMPLDTRWFVCYYGTGGSITWWEKLRHDPKRVKRCTLKILDKVGTDPMDVTFVCK